MPGSQIGSIITQNLFHFFGGTCCTCKTLQDSMKENLVIKVDYSKLRDRNGLNKRNFYIAHRKQKFSIHNSYFYYQQSPSTYFIYRRG